MTHWLKDAFLDILSLLAIVLYAITLNNIIVIVLWVYSSLLLVSKVLVLSTSFLQNKASKTKVPDYIYHLIYLLSVSALIYSTNYYLAGLWAVIWILSSIPKIKAYYSKKN